MPYASADATQLDVELSWVELLRYKRGLRKPVGGIRYTDSFGKVETASSDESKAEAMCDFFSSMFIKEWKI